MDGNGIWAKILETSTHQQAFRSDQSFLFCGDPFVSGCFLSFSRRASKNWEASNQPWEHLVAPVCIKNGTPRGHFIARMVPRRLKNRQWIISTSNKKGNNYK